jgi:scyllo-inositol 2-dehydrogenase (NADP+)
VTGQVSVNWSDETMRKMTTRVTVYGDGGKIFADRQELHVFIGATGTPTDAYGSGWTMRNITELTENTDYYLRGEEYSAQMDAFGQSMLAGKGVSENDFFSAADTDLALEMIRAEAAAAVDRVPAAAIPVVQAPRPRGLLSRVMGR